MRFPVERGERLGRPTRKAAQAAIEAHLSAGKGGGLKQAIADALAEHRGLGGQERRFVAVAVRELARHLRLIDAVGRWAKAPAGALAEDGALVRYVIWRRLGGAEWAQIAPEVRLPGPVRPRSIRDDALEAAARFDPEQFPLPEDPLEAAATLYSLPRWLSRSLSDSVGDEAPALFEALCREPELILRARPPLDAQGAVAQLAEDGVRAEAIPPFEGAIRVTEPGTRVFDSALMKRGGLQVQDLGSQLIAQLCDPGGGFDGARIADLCAGAAGKTIALADRVGPKGRVFASDRSARRLAEGRSRVKRAGLRNVSFGEVELAQVDTVLIDAPCSGTGTLAREPDLKWRLDAKKLETLEAAQAELLDRAAKEARPGAVIVYATCSLLREEGEAQIDRALAAHPSLRLEPAGTLLPGEACEGPYLRLWPHRAKGAGFFAARLRKG